MLLSSPTVRDLSRLTARVFAARESGARLDAYRRDHDFFIDIDLPGTDPVAIDITVDSEVLTVRAERKSDGTAAAGGNSREIPLAALLDVDRLEARCANGVLTLLIPVVAQRELAGV
ncbi:HSP20 family protein [Actinoplanes lutulentus]|uniref:HSP20 family protein n=1 Tax=Actinoplanes lutulentus TaxID=1287878 RepID=A0A327ZE12_9ACTN|nr:Hsp20/alpha crystallin family protein [Actinoplanes lutulentus]MBB2942578.1 HSP20 family protein [Actinoplanes lutulentus]RAK38159.1 HSP20 family protein [Actinoplanes lutulentus]